VRVNFGPSVRAGKPKDTQAYKLQTINRIDVYSPRDFDAPFPLTIDIESRFGIKMLMVAGWKLI
jgi:hypothetical protein